MTFRLVGSGRGSRPVDGQVCALKTCGKRIIAADVGICLSSHSPPRQAGGGNDIHVPGCLEQGAACDVCARGMLAACRSEELTIAEVEVTAEKSDTLANVQLLATGVAADLAAGSRTVIFSGAGISADAGIPTYRDGRGLTA